MLEELSEAQRPVVRVRGDGVVADDADRVAVEDAAAEPGVAPALVMGVGDGVSAGAVVGLPGGVTGGTAAGARWREVGAAGLGADAWGSGHV